MPAKAKKTTKKKTEDHVNGKHGEVISVEEFKEMQEYFTTAKDLVVVHDDEIDEMKKDIKDLIAKVDRALSRLGISLWLLMQVNLCGSLNLKLKKERKNSRQKISLPS